MYVNTSKKNIYKHFKVYFICPHSTKKFTGIHNRNETFA